VILEGNGVKDLNSWFHNPAQTAESGFEVSDPILSYGGILGRGLALTASSGRGSFPPFEP